MSLKHFLTLTPMLTASFRSKTFGQAIKTSLFPVKSYSSATGGEHSETGMCGNMQLLNNVNGRHQSLQ